jgi:hypothetical protein
MVAGGPAEIRTEHLRMQVYSVTGRPACLMRCKISQLLLFVALHLCFCTLQQNTQTSYFLFRHIVVLARHRNIHHAMTGFVCVSAWFNKIFSVSMWYAEPTHYLFSCWFFFFVILVRMIQNIHANKLLVFGSLRLCRSVIQRNL